MEKHINVYSYINKKDSLMWCAYSTCHDIQLYRSNYAIFHRDLRGKAGTGKSCGAVRIIKLGVANIAVITILYVLGVKEAIVINLLRIVLTSLLFGNVNSFLFSISGAALSLTIMIIMKKLDFFSCIGVSVCGGVMHNIGQIIAAVFIMGSEAIVFYLPVLIVSGVFTGVVIGVVSGIVAKHVRKVVS